MSRGHDPGGTDRLICSGLEDPGPPDDASDDRAGQQWNPNCVAGGYPNGDYLSVGARGGNLVTNGSRYPRTADFSFEAWIKRNYPDTVTGWQTAAAAAQGYCITGIMGSSPSNPVGFWFRDGTFEGRYSSVGTVSGTLPFGWCHVALNLDRSEAADGTELFINGVSQGTAACSVFDYTTSQLGICVMYADEAGAQSGKVDPPYRCAAFAYHTRLLTAAEIQDSVDNVTTQNFTTVTSQRVLVSDVYWSPPPDGSVVTSDSYSWAAPYNMSTDNLEDGYSPNPSCADYVDTMDEFPLTVRQATTSWHYTYSGDGGYAPSGPAFIPNTAVTYNTERTELYFEENGESSVNYSPNMFLCDDPSWPPSKGSVGIGYA